MSLYAEATLKKDKDGHKIQGALTPIGGDGNAQHVAYTDSAGKSAAITSGKVVFVILSTDGYIKFGGSSVAAVAGTDIFMVSNCGRFFNVGAYNYISAIRDTNSGTMHIDELE